MVDVIVIGCGIVGAAIAMELSKYEVSVLNLERENDIAAGTTKANSAIIHAGYDPEPGTLMARLNVEGAKLAKHLCRELDVPFQRCGSFVVAFSEEERETLGMLYDRGKANGVTDLSLLTKEQALAMEPGLNRDIVGALYAQTAAICNPWEYALALAETAVQNGVVLKRSQEVRRIIRQEHGYRVVTNRGEFSTRYIVNAAGVSADVIHNMVASPAFRSIPNRGEYYLLDRVEGEDGVRHVIFQCPTRKGKGVLVAPTVHGNILVGPSSQDISERDDVSTTKEMLEFVKKRAKLSVPGLDLTKNIRNFAGIRAHTDREDFIIEEAKDAPGFVDVAGIKSPGLSAAPAIAKLVAEILENAGLCLKEKKAYLMRRNKRSFRDLSLAEKDALIQSDPSYGNIVCRCMTITEGEIRDCLHAPIPANSIDGVKRRCGAGLGRCQGGFCGPKVLEILARELGKKPEEILQDKDGSFVLTGKAK